MRQPPARYAGARRSHRSHRSHRGVRLAIAGLVAATAAGCSAPAPSEEAASPQHAPGPTAPAGAPGAAGIASGTSGHPGPLLLASAGPSAGHGPVAPPLPLPDPDVLGDRLDATLSVPTGTLNASVIDARTGTVLYDRGADTPAVPASAAKILTAITALDELGPEHRYTTSAVLAPGTETAETPETTGTTGTTEVVLDAGGDVLLGTGESLDDDGPADGRAGLGTLAERTVVGLIDRGTSGTVTVGLDDSGYDGPALSTDWSPGLVATGQIAPVQPIATHGGRPGPDTGDGASGRLDDPALFAATAFQQELTRHAAARGADFTVAGDVERTQLDGQGTVLADVSSAPLAEQVEFMLHTSDNQVAEATGRNTAHAAGNPASITGATQTVTSGLADLEVDTSGMHLADTSGLSRRGEVSPEQLTSAMRVAASTPALHAAVARLPAAGEEGTLSDRMLGTEAVGSVDAKTGTLSGVTSLTGTVTTAEGRTLLFSFIANGQPPGTAGLGPARDAMDTAVAGLAGCGCR